MLKIGLLQVMTLPLQALIMGLSIASGGVVAQTLPVPNNLIILSSDAGEQLFIKSKARKDYWPLSIQFVTQKNQAYCGVASSVMVLNALKVPAPEAKEFAPYRVFTQDNFFDGQNQNLVTMEVVSKRGMTLDQLGGLLASHGVTAQVYHAGDTSLAEFRAQVVKNLQDSNNFVLVNYLRRAIGEETGGHISPIAAYNKKSDRFLILDVSRYKYPPVWVKAEELWKAMNTVDSDSGKTRGFVLVSATNSGTVSQSSAVAK